MRVRTCWGGGVLLFVTPKPSQPWQYLFKIRRKEWARILERGGTSGSTIRDEGGGNALPGMRVRTCRGKGVGWLFLTHISIFHEICCMPMQISEIQSASLAIMPSVARRCQYPKSKAHLLLLCMTSESNRLRYSHRFELHGNYVVWSMEKSKSTATACLLLTLTGKDMGKSSFTWSSLELWGLSTKTIQRGLWHTLIWITIR